MGQTMLIAVREFRQRVRQRGFWFSSLALPLVLIVIWAATGVLGGGAPEAEEIQEPIQEQGTEVIEGYIDQAGIIQQIPAMVQENRFREYSSMDAANQALQSEAIDAYYIIPADFQESGEIRRVSEQLPTGAVQNTQFEWLLLGNLFPEADEQTLLRYRNPLQGGPRFVTLTPSGEAGAEGNTMLPFLVAFVIMIPLFTSGSYLFQSVVKEKENRVMELLLLSVRPRQLLTGKLIGLGALALVQYLGWVLMTLIALLVTDTDISRLLVGISLSLQEVLLILPYALGGFALYAGLMAGVGALAPDIESSRMWIFMLTLPIMIPIYLSSVLASDPNGMLAVVLSLFPFSAPVSMLIRMTSTTVPAWQLGASLGLLALGSVGVIWLMARLFHAQTLLSGEKLSVGRFLEALAEG